MKIAIYVSLAALAERWWAILLRGLVAILFGVFAFAAPQMALLSLVYLFGAYALIDGALGLVAAMGARRRGRPWAALVLGGIVGTAVGLVALLSPEIAATALLALIAVWAIGVGLVEIAAGMWLRKLIRGEWILVFAGTLSLAFGVLIVARPSAGARAVIFWLGAYAFVSGLARVSLAFRLRAFRRRIPSAPIPRGGVPRPV